ncbi:hypothetical protein [Streptomyces roseoviridis]|uniref:Secreted protein n=1 Tax=Streptomyces roseoviridis TaxID=67361 RepID=A0ABV5QK42_9ACTN
MRVLHRGTVAFATAAALLTGTAVAAEVRAVPAPVDGSDAGAVTAAAAGERENFGASCGIVVEGSHVTAYCRNPYPDTDRVRLHVECARWWDLDTDSAPVAVAPADYARVTGRCWKEVGSAWITHEPAGRG